MEELIWAAVTFFVAESIQQEVNETVFWDFQHIRCLHLEHTCTNAADVVRCRRTRVVRASKQRYVKIEEGDLIHFRTFIQLCNSNLFLHFLNFLPKLLRALYQPVERAVLVQVHHKDSNRHCEDHTGYPVNFKTDIQKYQCPQRR